MNAEQRKEFAMERPNPDQLEQTMHAILRSLPDRRAPASLEARVLAELERRAAIPWWHKSYAFWPRPVQTLFLLFCGGMAGLLIFTGIQVQAGFAAAQTGGTFAPAFAFADHALGIGRGLADFVALVARHIPPSWVYGMIAFVAGLYAMLFGLGATAYRTLWLHR